MMETIIPCRNCDHPLKSGSCLGCNVFRLYEALQRGKLDWAKDEHNGIVESKLEQPTLSPDDLRPVVFCKDCKFAVETKQPFGDDILLCTSIYNVRFVKDSFYCADGEKR